MSCTIGSSPINVTSTISTNKTCDITCKYTYTYGNSSLNITNNSDHLVLSYDGSVDVQYNSNDYTIQEIRLYKPSLNSYNGNKMDAELIIHHIDNTNKNLLVCVPINNSNSLSKTNSLFNKIIPFAPSSSGDKISVNVTDYNLNTFIPEAPYYAYKGSLPYQPCNGTYDIILFHPDHAINMNSTNMSTINQIITGLDTKIKNISETTNPLFFNKKGTTQNTGGGNSDDIYIQCNELDNNGNIIPNENEIIRENKTDNVNNISVPTISKQTQVYLESFGGIIGGMILIFGVSYGIKKFLK